MRQILLILIFVLISSCNVSPNFYAGNEAYINTRGIGFCYFAIDEQSYVEFGKVALAKDSIGLLSLERKRGRF